MFRWTLQLRVFPADEGTTPWLAASFIEGSREVPMLHLASAIHDSFTGTSAGCPLWHARRWYPWYLAFLWCGALLAVRRQAPRTRRRLIVGSLLWGVSAILLVFEAAYLRGEYEPLLPSVFGRHEWILAWVVVAGILVFRRHGARHPAAVEATVASQALLGVAHAVTLPGTMARGWAGAFPAASVAEAVWVNFPPGFWVGLGGMLLAALPLAFRSSAPPS